MYFNLMQQGQSMKEIDEMDIHFYFEILSSKKEKKQGVKEVKYIDQIW